MNLYNIIRKLFNTIPFLDSFFLVCLAPFLLVLKFFFPRAMENIFIRKLTPNVAGLSLSKGHKKTALSLLRWVYDSYDYKPLHITNSLAIIYFLSGDYKSSEKFFSLLEVLKKEQLSNLDKECDFDYLDDSWTLAIGHLAHIDVFFKEKILNNELKKETLIFEPINQKIPGAPITKFYKQYGLSVQRANDASHRVKILSDKFNSSLDVNDIQSIATSFWYGRSESTEINLYGKYASSIHSKWNEKGFSPLAKSTTASKNEFRSRASSLLGLPEDAWYVLVHAREAGYHSSWHKHHPGTRNADIDTYLKAIEYITDKGGWVVRAGDSSMKPIPKMKQTIDYAASKFHLETLDIGLCENCEFFIGTNSGFSIIPGIFSVKSLLTNWSPIGIPNWYPNDIMVPKKVWDKSLNRYQTASEMFDCFSAWSQFEKDYKHSQLSVHDNTELEILNATKEMYALHFDDKKEFKATKKESHLQNLYDKIVIENDSYIGSRLSAAFIRDNNDFVS